MDPPDPHEVPDFRFKALRRVRLGDATPLPDSVNLVGVAGKIGLVAVAGDNCVYVVKTADIEAQDTGEKALRAVEVTDCPKVTVRLPGPVIHVAFSCDSLSLAVVVLGGMFPMVYLFDTRGLFTGDGPYQQVTLNTTSAGASVTSLCWNPAVAFMFTITFDDGSMALYSVKDDPVCITHPPAEGILAISWSPKGKQLVAARRDGRLTQYKPDLKEAKTISGPPVPGLKPVSILWVSTYEFLVAYIDTTQGDARPGLWMVKGSKAGPVTYTNYDDICYSTGEDRKQQYNMASIADWGMIVGASSGSVEVGVIGQEGEAWAQWLLEDSGRAELPLTEGNEERFPTGFTLDFTSQKPTAMGEGFAPPSPILHILSTDGLLCSYYCVNSRQGAAALCAPPEQVPMEGRRPGTIKLHLPEPVKSTPVPVMPTPIQKAPSISALPATILKPSGGGTGVFGGSSGGGGGGFLGGLGSSTPANDANKNPFGGGSSFGGTAPPSGGIFGGSGGAAPGSSVFGGGSGGSTFGGGGGGNGAFSGGSTVQSQGFASPTKQASGFGAAPAFGSPPAFGGSAAFGGTPAFGTGASFGGGATFGSAPASGSTFGSAAPGGSTFGSTGSSGFGDGAAESAPTFGSVAQNTGGSFGGFGAAAAAPPAPTFGGGGGTFGGGDGFGGGGGGTFGAPPSGGGSAFGGGGGGATSPGGTSFNSWR